MKELPNYMNIHQAVKELRDGKVIAYPTESVFGLGCDPHNEQALQQLLTIKQRPQEKGLILIASNYSQLQAFIDESQLPIERLEQIKQTWPGPNTWIMPIGKDISPLLIGAFNSIAVRVSAHPIVQQLCDAYGGAITSTSANLSGMPACKTAKEVHQQLTHQAILCVEGDVGGYLNPSEIRDALTLELLRKG